MPTSRYSPLFAGKRILVVEDEFLLANEARTMLVKLGATVVGPTPRVDRALTIIETEQVDAAILDICLDGALVFPVAERLADLAIPFVFASAFDPSIIPERFSGYVLCEKPVELEKIAHGLFGPPMTNA
ncbi:MAG TPA: response regulator [Shinella sp.]|nr:response regulator [Shinella sp.]MDX3977463.1 response regulator [Shinella sp.]HEV7249887.1 response regulator [Shinella sp.]